MTESNVLDLCRLPPEKATEVGYTKQRLVLFDLDGAAVTHGPEQELDNKGHWVEGRQHRIFQQVRMHEHLRNVFFGKFPLRRHHTVAASITAPPELWAKQTISADDMIRTATLDPFTAYSIACAEWVVLPRVSKKEATWQQVQRKRLVNNQWVQYQAWSLSTTLTYEVTAFHFENGTWINKGKVEGDNTLIDIAGGLNETGDAVNSAVHELKHAGHQGRRPTLSALPDPSCKVPLVSDLKAVSDGITNCNAAASAVTQSAEKALHSSGGANASKPGGASDATTSHGSQGDLDSTLEITLSAATSGNPRASAAGILKAKAEGQLPASALETATAAESMYATCKTSVESIVQAGNQLRAMASNPMGTAQDAALGFAGCAGIPLSYDISGATSPGSEQKHSTFCANVDDDVSHGTEAMRSVATCEGRITGEHSSLAVRVSATNRYWHMRLPLLKCTGPVKNDTLCIAVGRSEGIRRGDQFIAQTHHGEVLGYGRITAQGAGGGEISPEALSQFRFRAGFAPTGSTMHERAKVGMLLGLRPQAALLLRHGSLASSALVGGALEAGYNGGPFVPIGDEFWLRTNLAYMVGKDNEYFFHIEVVPEAQYYLFSHIAAYVQSGIAIELAGKDVRTGTGTESVSGFTLAAMLGSGLDASITPDWNLRLGVTAAQAFLPMRLQNSAKTVSVNAGLLTWAQGGLSVDYNF